MNINSNQSLEQSVDSQSQRASFREPKPPRTPERQKGRAKSPSSSHRKVTPRVIQQVQVNIQSDGQRQPLRGSRGHDSSVKLLPQDRDRLTVDECRNGVQDGWPSPAMTHLGTHIQNYHLMMENGGYKAYESPIFDVKLQNNNEEDSPKSSEQQQQQMKLTRLSGTQPKEKEYKDTANGQRYPTEKSPILKHVQSAPHDYAASACESTTLAASKNWLNQTQTPQIQDGGPGERDGEYQDEDNNANFYPSSAPYNYYHPYAAGPMPPNPYYGQNPYYYGPTHPQSGPQGAYMPHEYTGGAGGPPRGYPSVPHMMSPHTRHPVYSRQHHPQQYYYEQVPTAMYPPGHHPSAGQFYPASAPYYPPPPGAYYSGGAGGDPNTAKYHHTMARPGAYPPPYLNDEYAASYGPPMHPYSQPVMANPYEGSPGQMPYMMPPIMQSPGPHMAQCPQALSVHKSNTKSNKQRRSGGSKHATGERKSCNGGVIEPQARTSKIHPRQLNFNDDSVGSDKQHQICFEDVDETSRSKCDNSSQHQEVQDNDDDRFEVVKIKLNRPQNDSKDPSNSRRSTQTKKQIALTTKSRPVSEFPLLEDQASLCRTDSRQAETQPASLIGHSNDNFEHPQATEHKQIVSIRTQATKNQTLIHQGESTPDNRPKFSRSLITGSMVHVKETSIISEKAINSAACHSQNPAKLFVSDKGSANRQPIGADEESQMEVASSSVCNTMHSGTTLNNSKRRGYIFNEVNGQLERVIRKRKRKTAFQLEELANAFDSDPHWSKETLLDIATKTSLTEAQVYKWGWDQKRKKYGVVEAERMRQYENILDQQNAKKAAAFMGKLKKVSIGVEHMVDEVLVKKREPEITPENRSQNNGTSQRDLQVDAAEESEVPLLESKTLAKIQSGIHASAEQAYPSKENDSQALAQVSAFTTELPVRQQMTVKKPSNGLKNNEHLQKSATTNTNTVQVSLMSGAYTPKQDNHSKALYDHDDDCSPAGLATPEQQVLHNPADSTLKKESQVSQRRSLKQQTKEQVKLRKHLVVPASMEQPKVGLNPELSQITQVSQLQLKQAGACEAQVVPRKMRTRAHLSNQESQEIPSSSTSTRGLEQADTRSSMRRAKRGATTRSQKTTTSNVEQ